MLLSRKQVAGAFPSFGLQRLASSDIGLGCVRRVELAYLSAKLFVCSFCSFRHILPARLINRRLEQTERCSACRGLKVAYRIIVRAAEHC